MTGELKIRVDGVDRMLRDLERDFHRGMEKAADELADQVKDEARNVIQQNDAIFNREVYQSFREAEVRNSKFHVTNKVYNTAAHAGALDRGVDAAEYADGGPPVQALLPWVARKMDGWDMDLDSDGGGGGKSTTTVLVQDFNGNDIQSEIPDTWNTYDDLVQPEREEMFIGQEVTIADRNNGGTYDATVVEYGFTGSHPIVTLELGPGLTRDVLVGSTGNGEIFIGMEDLYNLTESKRMDKAESLIQKMDTDHQPEVQDHFADVIRRRWASNLRDDELLFDTLNSMVETTDDVSSDAAGSASPVHNDTAWVVNLKSTNREDTIFHEYTHGLHFTMGYTRSRYADVPGHKSKYVFPHFKFFRDGTSENDDNGLLKEHLMGDSNRVDIPGEGDTQQMYDRAVGDWNVDYDTNLPFDQILDPDADHLDAGDAIKFISDGNEHEVMVQDVDPTHVTWHGQDNWVYNVEKFGGQETSLGVNADGSPTNDNLEIVGVAKQPDSIGDLPITKDDANEALIEAANLAWMKSAFAISNHYHTDGKRVESYKSDIPYTWRAYSTKNPVEMLTTLTEIMLSDNEIGHKKTMPGATLVRKLDDDFPGLMEAWIEVFEPSEPVKDELDKMGIDY